MHICPRGRGRGVCEQPDDELHDGCHVSPNMSSWSPGHWLLSPLPTLRHCVFLFPYLLVTLTSADEEIRWNQITRRGGVMTLRLFSQSSPDDCTHTHVDTLKHTYKSSLTYESLGPLPPWVFDELNSHWKYWRMNYFTPVPLLSVWLCLLSIYTEWYHLSPRALLEELNLSTLIPPTAPEWWRDDCEAFKDTQPKMCWEVCRGWPLSSGLRAVSPLSPHARGYRLSSRSATCGAWHRHVSWRQAR